MNRIVTILHQRDSILDNKTIRVLSNRRVDKNDTVLMINMGSGRIEASLNGCDIVSNPKNIFDISKLPFNSVFIHLPYNKLSNNIGLIKKSDLIVLTSLNKVMNISEFDCLEKVFEEKRLFKKTTIVFEG